MLSVLVTDLSVCSWEVTQCNYFSDRDSAAVCPELGLGFLGIFMLNIFCAAWAMVDIATHTYTTVTMFSFTRGIGN